MRQLLLWDPPTPRLSGRSTDLVAGHRVDPASAPDAQSQQRRPSTPGVRERHSRGPSDGWPPAAQHTRLEPDHHARPETDRSAQAHPLAGALTAPVGADSQERGSGDTAARAVDAQPFRAATQPSVEFVRHPRARRYLIRVRLDGSVRVTIPSRGSKREAVAFYEQQRDWVVAHQRRVAGVRASLPHDLPDAAQHVLRVRARRELPARLLELAQTSGVSVRKISVRNQRHRWGSCSASGLICLNWRLVTMPDWVRDYVLYHELMHLKRMDHSAAFWMFVEEVCPNYRAARRWLRRHALAPHATAAHADTSVSGEDDTYNDC